jgi:orotidine-5'-phosphate decarboxylase
LASKPVKLIMQAGSSLGMAGNREFADRLRELSSERNSVLCLGLDPALPRQRDKYVIPRKYVTESDDNEARLKFCRDIIGLAADFCVAVKFNEQYLRGLTADCHKELAYLVRGLGMLSIYDCKLGDIGDTVESAVFHISEWGYDAITVNPLPGNLEWVVKVAHGRDPPLGVLALTLMSNPESERFMKSATVDGVPLYLVVAQDVRRYGADGCVVGATGHVTGLDIRLVREAAGDDKVLLVPGVGTQMGDPEKVFRFGGESVLINVGRDIIYSEDPRRKAREWNDTLNEIRKRIH